MRRIILWLVIILVIICGTGCFNYKDINRTIFVTSIGIDMDAFNNISLYAETFIPSRGEQIETGEERKTVFKSNANSLFEAARNISLMSNYLISYSQCRAVVLTEKAAKYGFDNFIDLFARNQSLHLRAYVFLTSEDIEEILGTNMKEEKYTGVFLSELAENTDESSKGVTLRLDEFFNNRLLGAKTNVVNMLELKKDQKEPRIQISGLAIIKDDKLVDVLSREESMALNFLNNKFKKGSINIGNPEESDKLATIELLKSKTKSELKLEDNKILIKKTIKAQGSFAFAEKSIYLTNDTLRNKLEISSEQYITTICKRLFKDFKEKDIDIFNLEREFQMKYPRVKIEDLLKNSELDIEADVNIKGSGEIMNFQ